MAATDDVIEKGELEDTKVGGGNYQLEKCLLTSIFSCRRLRKIRSPTARREREKRRRMSVTPVKTTRRSYSFR